MTTEDQIQQWINDARALGAEHGRTAAGWTVDGNTKTELIPALLEMFDAGDPERFDYLPAMPDLSGEWADGLTPARLIEEIDAPSRVPDDIWDDLCTAYEEGVSEAFEPECERILRATL